MSWMDIFLLFLVMLGMVAGYIQGLLRQLMSLASLLAALILATYLQMFLTGWFGYISPGTPFVVRGTVAFLLLVAIIATVLDVAARRAFPETSLVSVAILDRLGGIFAGFFTVVVQVSVAVLIFKFLASVSWPIGNTLRLVLTRGIESSTLLPVFYDLLVFFVRTIGVLLPEDVTGFLNLI